MNQAVSALAPEYISAKRADVFVLAAEEIERIDKVKPTELIKGKISVGLGAIQGAIGRNERVLNDLAKTDPLKFSR